MKKREKEIEDLIYSELSAEKPNESVLDAAKLQMKKNAQRESTGGVTENNRARHGAGGGTVALNPLAKRRIAVILCAVFALALLLCCGLPFVLREKEWANDDDVTPREISSISDYDGDLLCLGYEIESSVLYMDSESTPVYILEVYNDNGTQISLYVLLDPTKTDLDVFRSFGELLESDTYNGVLVEYGSASEGYAAAFSFDGYRYYISADVETGGQILLYVQELWNR